MRVLFIDDQESSVIDAIEALDAELDDFKHWVTDFEEGKSIISSLRPDIVVLDIWDGAPQISESEGQEIFDLIWNEQFCPLIVYTADSGKVEETNGMHHPFAEGISKGSGSDLKVLEAVRSFRPHISGLREAERIVRNALSQSMRDVAPYAFEYIGDADKRADTIVRAGRRRVAALMDDPLPDETRIAGWEQYICPPISPDLLLGDVLKVSNLQASDPSSFRLVLTPSCDLVSSGGRVPKVREVLVAKCVSMKVALRSLGITIGNREKDLTEHPLLSQGYSNAIVPFPELKGKVPTMAANLRELELVSISNIGSECADFLRVASIDSPFREMVAWAYLQISARPGMPDRDIESWSAEINESVRNQDEDDGT